MTAAPSNTVAFVSALSVMLASYGFLYNAVKDRISAAYSVGDAAAEEVARTKQRKTVTQAAGTAALLSAVAFLVWLIFLPTTVDKIDDAIDVHFSLSHYSALAVVLVALANSWAVIGIALAWQALLIWRKRSTYNTD